jgi:predicted RNA-binding protein with PIN domain
MLYLIDGYNLLNVADVPVPIRGKANLEKARLALLNFLAASLDPAAVPQTVVVFDAHDPPPGVPREMRHKGLLVRFAAREEDADTLIEELIREDNSPRRLTVVSSDHRIQRAAKRRKARAVDSDIWYAEVIRGRQQRQQAADEGPERPGGALLEEDVRYWLREFGVDEKRKP